MSHPKANGYQALHVTLMGNNGQWIEVQIRSERMNDVAEQGFAAHWKYKEGGGSEDEGELEKWLRTIKEILDDPQPDAIDFLDTIKLNLFASEIFVFTPKGEIKTMPQNSTALDFAFSLHTDIGSHCIGAKVNHKLVPLSHKLQSGDQVEILTSKSQRVQPEWEVYATTARARAKSHLSCARKPKPIKSKVKQSFPNSSRMKIYAWTTEHWTSSPVCTISIPETNCSSPSAARNSYWAMRIKCIQGETEHQLEEVPDFLFRQQRQQGCQGTTRRKAPQEKSIPSRY